DFTPLDNGKGRRVAIVSRTFAERHWPGGAVGRFVQMTDPPSDPLEIVGVVSDVKQFALESAPTPDLYLPMLQTPESQAGQLRARMYWVVRTRGVPEHLEGGIRDAVHAVDADVATSSTRTLEAVLATSLNPRRLNVRLLEFFGGVS